MICGVDCNPSDNNCNGYCEGRAIAPPEATQEMIISRKKDRAFKALAVAEKAWHEYFVACDLGDERIHAARVYENIRTATAN